MSFEEEVKIFAEDIQVSNVYRHPIASWYSSSRSIHLQVDLIIVMDNFPDSPDYDADVLITNGHYFELKYNGEMYRLNTKAEVGEKIKEVML